MTVLVVTLMVLGSAYAAATIFFTLRHYRGAAGILNDMLTQCRDEQELRISVCEWTVSETASILRPDFTRQRTSPSSGRELRAAA